MAGHRGTGGAVSGSERFPVIDLRGSSMSALALAIPAIASRTGREVVVIGRHVRRDDQLEGVARDADADA